MQPKHYFDIDVNAASADTGMTAPMLRGRLLSFLHPLFTQNLHTYALAIPLAAGAGCTSGGGRLRVFASSREHLDTLAASLSALPWVRDYARLSYPCTVPDGFAGPWVRFRRYRVPSLASDRREGEERGKLRQKRMESAQAQGLDYFILSSQSTKQGFSLLVMRESGTAQHEDCQPNSYGLCTTQNLFSVPDLP